MPDWTKAEAVAAQLIEWGHEAEPVAITIGRTTYVGASYRPSDSEEEGERRIYLLGDIPPSKKRGVVYRLPGDEGDWYIAAWVEPHTVANPTFAAYHPFGVHFMLHRWPHEQFGERIDAHDDNELRRMDIARLEPQHA